MRIGIDASNIHNGGGLTHLKELIHGFNHVKFPSLVIIVFSTIGTLQELPEATWLVKIEVSKNIFIQVLWRFFYLPLKMRELNAEILFVPGGVCFANFKPFVTMSQNMLVFEQKERSRFGLLTWSRLRLKLLYYLQKYAFLRADGLIFISDYAKQFISSKITLNKQYPIIYHGIETRFMNSRIKEQQPIESYSEETPYSLLYVSIVDQYKHQWVVVEAVEKLRKMGYPIVLHLIGGSYPPALRKLEKQIQKSDPKKDFIKYYGKIRYEHIEQIYKNADAFIFASTCENMPNILVEAMAAGIPIACSSYGPMSEILDDAGVYFDPVDISDTTRAIKYLVDDYNMRTMLAEKAFSRSQKFSWEGCATDTFNYIMNVHSEYKSNHS